MKLKGLDYPRILFWMIQVSYAILMGMAIYFYQERLAPDTSYYFFKSLNSQNFHIEHQRWVLGVAELPVVILSRLHAPLTLIMKVYSVWHLLFFYIIGLFIYMRYRQHVAWLLLLLLQLVGIRYGFTCPVFEQFYGTALAVLFFVMLRQPSSTRKLHIILQLILWVWVIGSHPFNIILGCFLLAFDFCDNRNWKKYLPYLIVLPLFLIYKKINASTYESDKMNWIFDVAHNKTYLHLFQMDYYKQAGAYLWEHYKDVSIIAFGWVVYCLFTLRWFKLLVTLSFLSGAFLLINFGYDMTEYSGYNEQLYFILVVLVLIPFLFEIAPLPKHHISILAAICLTGLVICLHIKDQFQEATHFQIRTQLTKKWIRQSQLVAGNKFYIDQLKYPDASHYLGWDIPYFSLLLSATDPNIKQVSILNFEETPSLSSLQIEKDSFFARQEEKMAIRQLNPTYFSFKPISARYTPLE